MQKHWFIKQVPSDEKIQVVIDNLKVSPIMASLLAQRNLTSLPQIRSFFTPEISSLHDPFLMLNMNRAVDRLESAVQNQERILIFGDYDVDGTTAVALVYSVLKEFTSVDFYIPDRYEEGYGLSYQGIDLALKNGCSLMIALDCGIKEIEKVAYAREKGLDVIICDHHNPGPKVPDGIILDPKQEDCAYPFKELCGCGVGFKLMQAWFSKTGKDATTLFQYLDLVAIAIGADIVPVTGENRILCKQGIQMLNENPRAGILALVEQAKRSFPLDLSNVVFTIAPRINAAGRLKSGSRAVELLLSETPKEAQLIALEIDEYNSERRILDAQITEEALDLIAQDDLFLSRKSTVVFQSDWHKGVVGIVASRLIEHHYRPTIVLTENKGEATGSARSVSGFNVYDAITSCEHLLTQYGGHQHAAGLSLPLENVASFREHFDSYVQKNIQPLDEVEELVIDLEIGLSELFLAGESALQIPRLYKMLEQMEPFGPGNDKPVFCAKNMYADKTRILKEAHLKFDLVDPISRIQLSAIGFNMADKADLIAAGCAFDCAFTLEKNVWNNRATLQLQIRDVRETL
ncbi:single-stranded-DNA-specific exonuclease RecJ [Fluviicola taffensis]|uniref:Single-stranded-DNA-specific exonuclease RecJ n=1 Tax=Fluviicola taffensis (strain DSM 16823 / NCIMB 13979 / RW262) TaxID=755732 RepID=F2IED1_FLUTR|nr:single-stranded-DNA-specific exonuclease RecJ [Fluviicola taffensis]AEA43455.1 single-stranded-DNA-specific exonuclease RecJ [Fluviicola taffensis DSM 16823]